MSKIKRKQTEEKSIYPELLMSNWFVCKMTNNYLQSLQLTELAYGTEKTKARLNAKHTHIHLLMSGGAHQYSKQEAHDI